MPVGVAAIGAAGVLGGAYLAKRGSDNANKTQQHSTDQALKYQTDRQAIEDKRYNDAWNDYLTRHKAWEQRNFGGGAPGGATPAAASPGSGAVELSGLDLGGGTNLADLLKPQGQAVAPDQAKTTGWNDWARYGAGGV